MILRNWIFSAVKHEGREPQPEVHTPETAHPGWRCSAAESTSRPTRTKESNDAQELLDQWGAPVDSDDELYGYRGVSLTGISFGSSEGEGRYLAKSPDLAHLFSEVDGRTQTVRFKRPHNPLVIDNEPLYVLSEDDRLEEPPRKGDSVWLTYAKRATARMYRKTGGRWDAEQVGQKLTRLLQADGYDSVYVRSGEDEWVVLFN